MKIKGKKQPKYILLLSYIYLQMFIHAVGVLTCIAMLKDNGLAWVSGTSTEVIILAGALLTFNLLCLRALTRWKRWGLWGFMIGTTFAIPIGIDFGSSLTHSIAGCLSFIVLIVLYLVGGKKKAWNKLT